MTRVVALDLMDTMLRDPFREALAAGLGPDWLDVLRDRPRDVWPRFERGEITEDQFWALTGPGVDRAAFDRVRREGMTWLPGMSELVDDLRAAGVAVVVATNYPIWIDDVERHFLVGRVDGVVASCRIAARKPDPAFYEAVVAAASRACGADVAAADVVFVDDRPANVDGAEAVGLQGLLFEGAAGLRRDLADRGITVAA